jgi:hypothetical protein
MQQLFNKIKLSFFPIVISTVFLTLYSLLVFSPRFSLTSNIETMALLAGLSIPIWFLSNIVGTILYSIYFWFKSRKKSGDITIIAANIFIFLPLISLLFIVIPLALLFILRFLRIL